MAWDTERTRALLCEAATTLFSKCGYSGTKVDAVAREAGVNKERIYQYFGNKEGLFESVLVHELRDVLLAVEIADTGPEAVGEFAGELFDGYSRNPALPRLLAWEGLETEASALGARSLAGGLARETSCQAKVAAIEAALPGISHEEAAQLMLTIISLSCAWWVLPQMRYFILGDQWTPEDRRTQIAQQVTAIARSLVPA